MNLSITDLAAGLTALEESFRQLRSRLLQAADHLGTSGQPPSEELVAQAMTARNDFEQLRATVFEQAAAEEVPSHEPVTSIPQLTELLGRVTEAQGNRMVREKQKRVRQEAAQVLERVLGIKHRDRADFPPLAQCQARGRDLLQAVETAAGEPPAEVQHLAEGTHALCDVVTLLESYRVIDDERWQHLHDHIAEAFGRELALAIVRGRLTFPAATPPPSPPAPPSAPPAPEPAPAAAGTESANGQESAAAEPGPSLPPPRLASPVGREDPLPDGVPFDGWRQGPLTERQLTDLLAPSNGVALLFGSPLAGLDDVEEQLRTACREGRLITLDGATDRGGFVRELEGLAEDRPEGLILVLVPSYCAWNEDWVRQAVQQVSRQAAPKKLTRVVFTADPPVAWYWVQLSKNVRDRIAGAGVAEFSLHPWSDAAVAAWLGEMGVGPVDAAARGWIARATGNWTLLLQQLAGRCQENPESWQDELVALEKELASNRNPWRNSLGMVPQALPVLKSLAGVSEPVTAADLAGQLAGRRQPGAVEAVIRWADLLHYVHPAGHSKWTLDPLVRQAVDQLTEEWQP